MDFEIEFNEEKNELLKKTRGICFDDVIEIIKQDKSIDDVKHHNQKKYKNKEFLSYQLKTTFTLCHTL